MKFITAVLALLFGSHQILAASLPSSLLSAKAKLAELKSQLDSEIASLPAITLPKYEPKISVPLTGQVPDFESRKVTLESMKAKLTAMQAAQLKEGKPSPAFLAEMKKTFEESMNIKMVKFEAPKFNPKAPKSLLAKADQVVNPHLAKVDIQLRNVDNFTAELNRLHDMSTDLHRKMLEDTRVERNGMTDVVFGVYNDMTQTLGRITESLWQTQRSVQDLIDYDESIGAAADCVNEQREIFNERTGAYGRQVSFCAGYILSRARMYFATTFYPILDFTMLAISQLQDLVLGASSRTNFSRDQEALILFIEQELHSIEELWYNNVLVVLRWEELRFDDEMLIYREELTDCLDYVQTSYERVATEIITALENCPVPTRGRPMHSKPKA